MVSAFLMAKSFLKIFWRFFDFSNLIFMQKSRVKPEKRHFSIDMKYLFLLRKLTWVNYIGNVDVLVKRSANYFNINIFHLK